MNAGHGRAGSGRSPNCSIAPGLALPYVAVMPDDDDMMTPPERDPARQRRKFTANLRDPRTIKALAVSSVVILAVCILSVVLLPPEWASVPIIIVSALLGGLLSELIHRDKAGPT